jgi:hypothetical protein
MCAGVSKSQRGWLARWVHLVGERTHPMARSRPSRRTFGLLEERTSAVTGKVTSVRARYVGPDTEKHPRSFGDRIAAEAWLNAERILIDRGEWKPPKVRECEERLARQRAITLAEWAERSVANKKLRPSTRARGPVQRVPGALLDLERRCRPRAAGRVAAKVKRGLQPGPRKVCQVATSYRQSPDGAGR